ncbi:hypothetical protein [Demetria terragena]|uniref:hypothetical protein n=1 Tax=Demetria terragena TaxID=63959 RepID=UPI00037DE379|nr:hypothetical protein [Demetria terragena]
MHHANHFYGHAHIMARYTGLAEVPRIWGYLQHGWNTYDGFAVGTKFAPNYPRLVWSSSVARRAWSLGLRQNIVVAAPWAYLLELEGVSTANAGIDDREGTIVYPFHGWEGQSIIGDHELYLQQVREVEGDVPITMCLYWNEYRDPAVRSIYEDAGFRVISHGERGYLWKDTDVHFLDKQLAEVRRHKRVVSNRLGSALIYGASVGCEVGIYGDPMILEAERVALGGREKQIRLFPELHQPFVPQDYAQALARAELGQDEMLCAEEIRDLFGWRDAVRGSLES